MEIEEIELDMAKLASWATLMKNSYIDLHAVNCEVKVLECQSAMLSIAQRTCASVDQKFICHKAFACMSVLI
jgi:hypothetical protein